MSELSYLEKLLDGVEVKWLPLGQLGELVRGNGLPKSDFTESGVPAIHYGQIYTFYGLSTETTKSFVSQETAKNLKKVNSGDVVITNTSENFTDVGKALVYLGKEQAVTGGHATIFKPNNAIIGKYFAYFTQTDAFANEKRKYSKGTKVIDVSASDMAKITIPIPCPENPEKSLAIQSKIVRILDTFSALTAELTAELNMRKKQYNYYRDQLLSFDDEQEKPIYLEKLLDGVEVEWLPLGKLGELVRGNGLPKSDFTESGVPAIHYGQIYTFYGLSTETTKSFVSHETAKKLKKVNSGDVVITNTSENFTDVGKALVYLGKEQAVTGGHATIFKPNSTIIGKYFAYFTQTDSFANGKRKYSKGTKVIDVSASDMAKIIIPIPCPENPEKSLAIQSEIVRILDKFDTLTNSITEGLPREIELRQKQYEYYRDLLFSFPKPETVSN
ncbi:TPA: restriction endonuclease subunit S [Escherichia coli]|uniref:restriction endonuclease subunit S n=1 Tax=Escherichia coli TaxID=562 RepID=UPI0007752FFC|nr:restriction endonuclease subunit S [Escherichia coli]EEU9236586.1 restriction endonuclease subunit S [Escherichia coli]EEW1971327.1 restriction endonuclease subunit S [Escherichia coli]EHI6630189.1 restriction endonuclease subunit S [Escherichia coli]EIT7819309.1 restriction endonuclease subunit S [Escherichia coli]ELD6523144.1 restriction endonuclease subunit S [Escherichia coli]